MGAQANARTDGRTECRSRAQQSTFATLSLGFKPKTDLVRLVLVVGTQLRAFKC